MTSLFISALFDVAAAQDFLSSGMDWVAGRFSQDGRLIQSGARKDAQPMDVDAPIEAGLKAVSRFLVDNRAVLDSIQSICATEMELHLRGRALFLRLRMHHKPLGVRRLDPGMLTNCPVFPQVLGDIAARMRPGHWRTVLPSTFESHHARVALLAATPGLADLVHGMQQQWTSSSAFGLTLFRLDQVAVLSNDGVDLAWMAV